MSGFNPTDLIKQVKIRPGIYNKDAITPPRRDQKQRLWMEVAESLTPPKEWLSFTQEEKEMRIADFARKWRNLRDIFYREVKLLEAGETNKKRKYIHFNEMEFVRPYIGYKQPPLNKRKNKSSDSLKNTKESLANDSDIDMEEFLQTKKKSVKQKGKSSARKFNFKTSPVKKNTPHIRQSKRFCRTSSAANHSQKEDIIDNFNILEKTYVAKNPTFKIRESDLSFCLSLVPTLRKMNDFRKLSAKIDILEALQKYVAPTEFDEQAPNSRRDKQNDHQYLVIDELMEESEEGDTVKADPLNGSNDRRSKW